MANKSLGAAKKAKKDEFYTQLQDIANELRHYRDHFRGKVVLCNCDDPYESNFFKFFALNFNAWGLRKLICTCYDGSPITGTQLDLFAHEGMAAAPGVRERRAYKIELTEVSDVNGDGAEDMRDVELILRRNPPVELRGNGDFRSAECVELLKEADIVCTNPPFSLFREYVALLVKYHKKFLIIGNQNAITYKEIFPLIKENKLWLGCGDCVRWFIVPKETDKIFKLDANGNKLVEGARSRWFTNLDHKKRHEELDLWKEYTPEEYPHYDNYDAIEVGKTQDIPCDWDGVMGVPITFLDKFNPEQFEIIGQTQGDSGKELGLKPYPRELKKLNKSLRDGQLYYMKEGYPQKPYARVLIRKKKQS